MAWKGMLFIMHTVACSSAIKIANTRSESSLITLKNNVNAYCNTKQVNQAINVSTAGHLKKSLEKVIEGAHVRKCTSNCIKRSKFVKISSILILVKLLKEMQLSTESLGTNETMSCETENVWRKLKNFEGLLKNG
ncbi:hypothetical protein HELRODRAFT_160658 [Helobdella robusta]|uniref:Uncharacterized protein n=1 Tax=Helobdella robusta TaxID=6412 RepID=T1EQK3_HELRO|nr:hypothetical protein HELRODRAFT_160658 [Helobdella robusta]ESO06484.1 hypothetical protein HELRODRAFT_160658 [Helobdella robusta]